MKEEIRFKQVRKFQSPQSYLHMVVSILYTLVDNCLIADQIDHLIEQTMGVWWKVGVLF